ncbi:hypothetical protein DDR33_02100 [Pararcticibacter amylolyticus]|uniref:Uncharacterized protein n=1 Tax=Pararcticibacter amylolyticus TaxID=2173175 RepID=A0A2U2PMP4_9SPHI|nr:hypothetical protein DDR33_02100 [Pararcticibacter amylolyticus]
MLDTVSVDVDNAATIASCWQKLYLEGAILIILIYFLACKFYPSQPLNAKEPAIPLNCWLL